PFIVQTFDNPALISFRRSIFDLISRSRANPSSNNATASLASPTLSVPNTGSTSVCSFINVSYSYRGDPLWYSPSSQTTSQRGTSRHGTSPHNSASSLRPSTHDF